MRSQLVLLVLATIFAPAQYALAQTSAVKSKATETELSNMHTRDNQALMKCASEGNEIKRLECFDEFTRRNNLAPTLKITNKSLRGRWRTFSQNDPLTDRSVHYATFDASDGKGRFGEAVQLIVRCKSGETEAFINWNTFLGTDSISVTDRIDKSPAKKSSWGISTDRKASFMPNALSTAIKFIESSSYVANLTPYGENPITAIFSIGGAKEAFADIRRDCKWDKIQDDMRRRSEEERKRHQEEDAERQKTYDLQDCEELLTSAKKYPNSDYSSGVYRYLDSSNRCLIKR